jgi:sugar lactone lactonase YvrE
MRNSKRFVSAGWVFALVATAGCGSSSSSTAPNNSPIGGLWVANYIGDQTPEFSTNQLVSGEQTPAVILPTTGMYTTGLALDPSGNMWQSDALSDNINMYSVSTRNKGGDIAPTASLTSPVLMDSLPGELAFDSRGNLWVPACGLQNPPAAGFIVEYTAAQLAAAGSQAPTIIMRTSAFGTNFCPWSIAFDASGNAWVADDNNARVVEYSAAQLVAGSNDVTPATTITITGLAHAGGVAFDKSGNLWVANDVSATTDVGTVVGLTPAQLGTGGSLTPNVTITMPANSDPVGLAFDAHGSLWISDLGNKAVYSLTSAQLTTGSPTPTVTLTTSIAPFGPAQPMFDPYATTKGTVSGAIVRHGAVAAEVTGGANRHMQRDKSTAGAQTTP